ncbi:MAG: hypothetical protein LC794_13400 [Acidobacteria bacterium]|nr:hypothetical protein [Acidobacteriota bacterium]MCA1627667.1 hypothetical protein [Acidobacteriota bacterium]
MSDTIFSDQGVLSTPILIALVTLKGYQEYRHGNSVYIEDLAGYLAKLKKKGVNIKSIALSRTLDKYWSDDVAQFVSDGLVFGFLTHNSPLQFDERRCLEVCKNAILGEVGDNEQLQKAFNEAREALELEPFETLAA